MLTMGTPGIIYVAVEPQEGRWGIDGLAGVVCTMLGRNPDSGSLFVFNRNKVPIRAVRWLAVGRKNWLFIGGDSVLPSAAALMSLCASVKRFALNPWA